MDQGVTADPEPLLTFGHGRLDVASLQRLVTDSGIELVVDIRRFPGSRHNEAVSRDHLPGTFTDVGVGYRWDERLGGRRHLTKDQDAISPDTWWRVAAFRAYAAHTRTSKFGDAVHDLLADVAHHRTAVMCSETVWWRCHRRIVADVVMVGHGVPVMHLGHDGRLSAAEPSDGARRLNGSDLLVWDGAST